MSSALATAALDGTVFGGASIVQHSLDQVVFLGVTGMGVGWGALELRYTCFISILPLHMLRHEKRNFVLLEIILHFSSHSVTG